MTPTKVTKVCCIGAGYVGGPTCAVIAAKCPHIRVCVVDSNPDKIATWNSDKLPIYEPGLEKIVKECRGKNLFFSSECVEEIASAELIFISVNTPTKTSGPGKGKAADLTNLENVSGLIVDTATGFKIIVEKSTVPVQAAESIAKTLAQSKRAEFEILSNPEFLSQGTAIKNLLQPDRVLIGGGSSERSQKSIEALCEIYGNWIDDSLIIRTDTCSAELAKLAANAFLAQRISSINAISAICEKIGVNVNEVAKTIGTDKRIGPEFLKASLGFGGSCFQKDILNMVDLAERYDLMEVSKYWHQIIIMNDYQKMRFARRISSVLEDLSDKRIAIFGFAFKANTGDTRETPAKSVCKHLIEKGARLSIYDPCVTEPQIKSDLKHASIPDSLIEIASTAADAARNSDAIVICTEWNEFRQIDYAQLYSIMKESPCIFDGRNIVDATVLSDIGFKIEMIGQRSTPSSSDNKHNGSEICTNISNSELSRLAKSAFLAQRISSINTISAICESTGANVNDVAKAIGMDKRIGPKFLEASLGFGGPYFQQDIVDLIELAEKLNLMEVAEYWRQVILINDYQKLKFARRIHSCLDDSLIDKRIAIFGFAFKANTDDSRDTPAKDVCKYLIEKGARLSIYDPCITEKQIKSDLEPCEIASTAIDAARNSDAIVICTEWNEFRHIDYAQLYSIMKKPAFLFDGRNVVDATVLSDIGFRIEMIGRR